MPVSSPSYFPPSRQNGSIIGITAGVNATGARVFLAGQSAGNGTTQPDLLVIGDHAFANPYSGDPLLADSVVLGSQAAKAVRIVGGSTIDSGMVIIGSQAATAALAIGESVIIGAHAVKGYTSEPGFNVGPPPAGQGIEFCTVIGARAFENTTAEGQFFNVTAVGAIIASAANLIGAVNSVIVGGSACLNAVFLNGATVVGSAAGLVLAQGSSANTFVGQSAGAGTTAGSSNTLLGAIAAADGAVSDNVVVGASSGARGDRNTVLGMGINTVLVNAFSNAILIGRGAATLATGTLDDRLVIETFDGSTQRSIVFAALDTGNCLIGNSDNTNRDFDGVNSRNILKLLNGTVGALAPVGGGYFYVNAGALHWVGSAGTDTPIAPA